MIDTGAAPNVIKENFVYNKKKINQREIFYLNGITPEKIKTLGSIEIELLGHPVTLHVVSKEFPIVQEGILGFDFLQDASKIDFEKKAITWQGIQFPFIQEETLILPARTRSTIYVRIANPEVSFGYVPRLRACEGVYLGEAMVTNRKGRALLQAVNSSERDVEFQIPTLELGEIEEEADMCLSNSTSSL